MNDKERLEAYLKRCERQRPKLLGSKAKIELYCVGQRKNNKMRIIKNQI